MKNHLVSSALIIVVTLLVVTAVPTQAQITYGRWRDINPTQYTADITGTLRGSAMRVGGTGAIGAGDGWAVGGDCQPATYPSTCLPSSGVGPIISHYDGFSWPLLGSPVTSAEWNSVNFCTAPGAPGLGLCSPNGDGSDGWIVGTDGTNAHALYWNGYSLTEQSSGLTAAENLTSVFVACHQQLPTDGGGGCSGMSGGALVVAVGQGATGTSTSGGTGVIYQFSNSAPNVLTGAWAPQPVSGAPTTVYNSVYMFSGSCSTGPCLEGYAVGNGGVIAVNMGSGWVASVQSGCTTTEDLLGVFVYAVSGIAGSAIAVGRGGVVCSTTNGSSWNSVSGIPTTEDLTGIFMVSSTEAWIVGEESVILHTTNFPAVGFTPMPVSSDTGSGTGITLYSASFTGSGNGWAVGSDGVIIQTANGGCGSLPAPGTPLACWGGSTSITQSPMLNTVFENSPTDAWAGGNFTTLDGTINAVLFHWDGTRWHRVPISTGLSPDIDGLYFTGGGDGWAVGGFCPHTGLCSSGTPVAFHWGGGGSTSSNQWAPIPITSCSCAAKSVFMTSGGYPGGDGWAVGTAGTIWHFSAGTFGTFSSPTTNNLYSVFVESPGSSSVAGYAVGDAGTILTLSYPAGSPLWASVGPLNGVTAPLYSVYFKDSTHGWIVGGSAGQPAVVMTTTDGGTTWSGGPNQVTGAPTGLVLYSVFVDSFGTGAGNGDGWAVGQDGSGNFVMVHYDGASWTVVPLSPPFVATSPGLALRSVALTNPQDGWAVGACEATIATCSAQTPPVSLAGIFHLDPPTPPVVGQVTTSTSSPTPSTSTITVVSTLSSSNTSTSSTPVTSTTSLTTSSLATTVVSTSISTMTVVSTPTTTSTSVTSSVSTPMVLPAIPGFPWESIIAGIMIGMAAIAIVRRRKK